MVKRFTSALLVLAVVAIGVVCLSTPANASTCGHQESGPTKDGTVVAVGGHNYHPTASMASAHMCPGGLIYISHVQGTCLPPGGIFAVYVRIKYSNGVVGNEVPTDNYQTIHVQVGTENTIPGPTFVILYRDYCNYGHSDGITVWS